MGHNQQTISDEQLMDLALRLGRRGSGNTAENPPVGCVIAKQDDIGTRIVGRGWTQKGGRPHAERVALAEAGELASGATAYVTLEPCSHHGKSPPCAEALIEAGIARVVCAHPDPDPRVAGRGFAMLKEKGIKIEEGLLQERAHLDLSGFLSRTVRGRPWLQAKMAISKDGMIGKRGVGNHPITGPEAKSRTYGYRAKADAILVSAETALIDNPSLTVRSPGLEARSPIRIVLDSKGRMDPKSTLVQSAKETPTWIMATGAIAADKALELEELGCTVILVEDKNGHVDLDLALSELGSRGINTLFVESGAKLAEVLLQQDLIDQFLLYQGVGNVGKGGIPAFGGQPKDALKSNGFVLNQSEMMGKDKLDVYIRAQSVYELNGRI